MAPRRSHKWYDGHRPQLWDDDEDCLFCNGGGPSDQLQSIQIYASSPYGEPEQEGKSHAQKAFTAAAELLGVNATIDWIDSAGLYDLKEKEIHLGPGAARHPGREGESARRCRRSPSRAR